MHWRIFALAGLAGLLGGCAHAGGGAARSPKAVETTYTHPAEVIYTPADWPQALHADLYCPEGPGPWPAVLLIYGGSWSASDHRWQMRPIAHKLARRGYVVMIAQYRGLPAYRYPAPVEDMRQALRWLRTQAATYRIDPGKVASYGFSAGGYLAALLGTADGPPEVRLQAVVAASAPTDLTLYPGGDILPRFLGTTYEQNPALYRSASPITYVSADDPPMFLYQGTDDKTVSPDHTKTFHAALDRAGVRNQVQWVEGRGHATTLIFGGAAEDAAISFLDDVLR